MFLSPTWPHALWSMSRRLMPSEAMAYGPTSSQDPRTIGPATPNRSVFPPPEPNTARPSNEPVDISIGQPSIDSDPKEVWAPWCAQKQLCCVAACTFVTCRQILCFLASILGFRRRLRIEISTEGVVKGGIKRGQLAN